MFYIIYFYI